MSCSSCASICLSSSWCFSFRFAVCFSFFLILFLSHYFFSFLLVVLFLFFFFFFSSRRRHTRCLSDWSSDVCSSDLSCGHNGAGGWQRRTLCCWCRRLLLSCRGFIIVHPRIRWNSDGEALVLPLLHGRDGAGQAGRWHGGPCLHRLRRDRP